MIKQYPLWLLSVFTIATLIFSPCATAEDNRSETATFGAGCYWCVEAVFQRVNGVTSVNPGFMGGHIANPTYNQVLTGRTGHAEVVNVIYDPSVVQYETLLAVFWRTHDPTTKNQQGPDFGTQYRSVVFWHSDQQKTAAQNAKTNLNKSGLYNAPVVTQIQRASTFYPAGPDHKNYYNENPDKQYCRRYIAPKLEKLEKLFGDKTKTVATETISEE